MIKKLGFLLFFSLCISGVIGYHVYDAIFTDNVSENKEIYIPNNSAYSDVKKILIDANVLDNQKYFDRVAQLMKYGDGKIKTGFYKIKKGWNNKELISILRSGAQSEINLTFNNVRKIENLAGTVGQVMEFDSLDFLSFVLDDKNLEKWNKTKENVLSQFIPDTYKVFWNDPVEKTVERLINEKNSFWENKVRKDKLDASNLTKEEVYTLASIVEKETLVNAEKPRVAGVYLNRLKKEIMLQADPTVVFAVGDFSIRRVLNKHLENDSPYNTYLHAGLPPGPIYMPSKSSIDAVLNPENHKYLYFCAKPDGSGEHQFAKTLAQHNQNARKYQRWLNKNKIMK